jgi:hypothetical protein
LVWKLVIKSAIIRKIKHSVGSAAGDRHRLKPIKITPMAAARRDYAV